MFRRIFYDKKELSQLYYFKERSQRTTKKTGGVIETLATACTSKIAGVPRGTGINDKVEKYAARIADLKGLLDLNLKKCFYELNHINRFIESVQDSEMRMILTLRYMQNLSWQKVAFAIGKHDKQCST